MNGTTWAIGSWNRNVERQGLDVFANFGARVAIGGDLLAIGAVGVGQRGQIFVYRQVDGDGWQPIYTISDDGDREMSLAIDNEQLFIATPERGGSQCCNGDNRGVIVSMFFDGYDEPVGREVMCTCVGRKLVAGRVAVSKNNVLVGFGENTDNHGGPTAVVFDRRQLLGVNTQADFEYLAVDRAHYGHNQTNVALNGDDAFIASPDSDYFGGSSSALVDGTGSGLATTVDLRRACLPNGDCACKVGSFGENCSETLKLGTRSTIGIEYDGVGARFGWSVDADGERVIVGGLGNSLNMKMVGLRLFGGKTLRMAGSLNSVCDHLLRARMVFGFSVLSLGISPPLVRMQCRSMEYRI